MKKLSYEEWVDQYRPIQNPYDGNETHEGRMFETDGAGYEFIKAQDKKVVWTLIDEDGLTWISAGHHYVNRLGYFVTEIEHDGTDIEIDVYTAEDRFGDAVYIATNAVILQFEWIDLPTRDEREKLILKLSDAISPIMKKYERTL